MSNDSEDNKQITIPISDENSTRIHNEVLKRRSLILNVMKPSLSLTSLPPNSSKETCNETNVTAERPYNSLKVCFLHNNKRDRQFRYQCIYFFHTKKLILEKERC